MALSETLRRFPPAAADYARSIYDHHWLEASWLYERRDVLRSQGALLSADGWMDLEARTNAHVRALAGGDHLVLDECEDKAVDGDVGELHTVVRVLCQRGEVERFKDLVGKIDWTDPLRGWAVADALAWDVPDSWQGLIRVLLTGDALPVKAIGPLARVIGMRGWPLGETLLGVLANRVGDLEALSWALGTLGYGPALPELYAVIRESKDADVRLAATVAALRFAPGEVLAWCEQVVELEDWAAIPLALGGGPSVWPALERAAQKEPTPLRMTALGLFGCISGIDLLLDNVEDETCGEAAAEGLYLLTGAELLEESIQRPPYSEARDSDVLDEPEDVPGLPICRLPRSRKAWSSWIREHGPMILDRVNTRTHAGRMSDPSSLLRRLTQAAVTMQLREWTQDELAIRYRLPSAHPRALETRRRTTIKRAQTTYEGRPRLAPGRWYLSMQPIV